MITSRREFLKTSGAGAVLAGAAWAAEPGLQKGRRPNIVLFVTDDQSDAGCYGNTVVKTPALDRLAAEGIRFTHAFCTTPSCSPSRSVILTGRHNHATGQYGLAHPYHHFVSFENQATLPKLLQDSGYRTIHAGKFHVAPKETFAFEEFFNFEFKDHKTSIDMAEAIQPVIEKEDNRPFFLYFCTREPHRPFQRSHADPVNPGDVRVPPFLPDTGECRKELAEYHMSCQEA
ncbi:MAG: sulfatase-like hydrolase/transferase, partial [Candidatus Hydrogenedentes bacterium]|nr:sulfatase-like hydrolase/transferase [Candidatus Hydrogenedentota bacterium]